jgi:DNA repair photolyase
MPLKKSQGNMYDWITYMHTHLAGRCPHECSYCYVQTNPHGVAPRYKGEPRLIEEELNIGYGSDGKIIFIEHMGDLFAKGIFDKWIDQILLHCRLFPKNTYVFQTKNPIRTSVFLSRFPSKSLIGTTIETNRIIPLVTSISKAPIPLDRYLGIKKCKGKGFDIFVTVEPIMDFDVDVLSGWLIDLKPSFVNIGADSKNCGLPEPSPDKIRVLIQALQKANITIKKKTNLKRLGI